MIEEAAASVEVSTLGVITRAELDTAISTAKAYPRDLTRFRGEVRSMCTLNEEVAEACLYSLERTDRDGKRVDIEGPSIRMAEIVLSCWGNARVIGRVLDDGGEFVVGQGVFVDLQRNVTVSKEVRRRITNREGRRYSADMIQVTSQAAVSIAIRNAVFGGIPGAFWNEAYQAAQSAAAGTLETLEKRRSSALAYCEGKGVSRERVFAFLEVSGLEGIDLEKLVRLRTRVAMMKNGELRPHEAFPEPEAEESSAAATPAPTRGMAGLKATVAGKPNGKAEPAGAPPAGLETPAEAALGDELAGKAGEPAPAGRTVLPLGAGANPACVKCGNEAQVVIDGVYYCTADEPKAKKGGKK